MKKISLTLVTALLAVMWLSCNSDSPTSPPPNQIPDLSQTPRENSEAELAAAVLSGQVIAPQYLYERVLGDLQNIREEFGDSLPVRNIKFFPHWAPSEIAIMIDSATLSDSILGAQRILDSLNAIYRCTSATRNYTWRIYEFNGVLNPFALMNIYATVPGIEMICPSGDRAGDWSLLGVSSSKRGEIDYFFRYGFGDCPAGCIYSVVFYFSTTSRTVTYHGYFPHDVQHPEAKPDWFDEAKQAIKTVMYPDCWSADST